MLPDFHFIHLQRNPAAVLDSHMRIPNVIEGWHYIERIKRFREKVIKYKGVYKRADKEILYGSKRWSSLFAHIIVQTLVLRDEITDTIEYEDLVKNGLNNQSFHEILNLGAIKNYHTLSIDAKEKKHYRLHGTKNPTNLFSWLKKFSSENYDVMYRILGKYSNLVFTPKDTSYGDVNKIPKINFVVGSSEFLPLTNRVISIGEYVDFLNALVTAKIDDPHRLLCVSNSRHTMYRVEKKYFAIRPNKPAVLISPLGALSYCCFLGGKLPHVNTYNTISTIFTKKIISDNKENINFGENIGVTSALGENREINDYFDMIGNTREIAVNNNNEYVVVGGSFRDELVDLSLRKQKSVYPLYRDLDIGFRVQFNEHKLSIRQLVDMIKSSSCHIDLLSKLQSFVLRGSYVAINIKGRQ